MIAIVDYQAGNLRSVQRACDALGLDAAVTADPERVAAAERIIFPGVGAAPSAMRTLTECGLDDALRRAFNGGAPILGICLGAQIILERTEEGPTQTLGLIEGTTRRLHPDDPALKIPHMGWNGIEPTQAHPLLEGVGSGDEFYFVHTFFPNPARPEHVMAHSDYGGPFPCAIGRRNLFATQFHPEKSGRFGLEMLARFARWDGHPGTKAT